MELQILELPPIGTHAYLLINPELKEAALFDAPMMAWKGIQEKLEEYECKLSGLYLTHGHWDHMIDCGVIADEGIPVFAHESDRVLIETPDVQNSFTMPGCEVPAGRITDLVEHGQHLKIVGFDCEVRHVPGHSPGSVLFFFKDLFFAISGDALFAGGVGRTDFPMCSEEELLKSIREQIYTLPSDTVICPGHGPRTTVQREMETNPFVQG